MNAEKKETAEQKLLKMIEASSGKGGSVLKAQQKVATKQGVLSVVVGVNRLLSIAVVIAVMLLINEIRVGTELLSKGVKMIMDKTFVHSALNTDNLIPSVQRLSYYLAVVNRRNIFQPYENEAVKSVVESSDKNSRIAQRTGSFRLVGISWLDRIDTASVMIEDTEKKVTYFLLKGEKIGDITVKNIYADSTKLGYENEEITIRYDKPQL